MQTIGHVFVQPEANDHRNVVLKSVEYIAENVIDWLLSIQSVGHHSPIVTFQMESQPKATLDSVTDLSQAAV